MSYERKGDDLSLNLSQREVQNNSVANTGGNANAVQLSDLNLSQRAADLSADDANVALLNDADLSQLATGSKSVEISVVEQLADVNLSQRQDAGQSSQVQNDSSAVELSDVNLSQRPDAGQSSKVQNADVKDGKAPNRKAGDDEFEKVSCTAWCPGGSATACLSGACIPWQCRNAFWTFFGRNVPLVDVTQNQTVQDELEMIGCLFDCFGRECCQCSRKKFEQN